MDVIAKALSVWVSGRQEMKIYELNTLSEKCHGKRTVKEGKSGEDMLGDARTWISEDLCSEVRLKSTSFKE